MKQDYFDSYCCDGFNYIKCATKSIWDSCFSYYYCCSVIFVVASLHIIIIIIVIVIT
jgi:hypothetical protein